MTTLRRELRLKVLKILDLNIKYWEGTGKAESLAEISEAIVDSILEEFFKGKQDENAS